MERLVVVGNGMAGARLVEDVLARGGDSRFAVTMFGDEPYGNYNRILLSSRARAAPTTPKDIFINPLAWYEENGVRLHAGVRGRRHRPRGARGPRRGRRRRALRPRW